MGIVYLDFSKVFNVVTDKVNGSSHNIVILDVVCRIYIIVSYKCKISMAGIPGLDKIRSKPPEVTKYIQTISSDKNCWGM